MKKTISIAIILVFCAFLNVSAQKTTETQEKKITDAEFKAVQKKSDDQTAGKNYRLKRSSKTYKRTDNSLSRYFNETVEYMLPDASRSVLENASAGEKPTMTETIQIRENLYTRINNGSWQMSSNRNNSQTQISGDSVEHIYKGTVDLSGKKAVLYESKYTNKISKGGRDFVTTTKVKNWFGTDGVLLRTEEEIETPNTITRKVFEYEYNVNIKIEAPIK